MLKSLSELKGYVLQAEDGEIGRCHDFLIEDRAWTVRYMVADTRKWLPGRRVLISPISLGTPDWERQRFPVRLTMDQIKMAPELDEHAPATREYEIWFHKHYDLPYYWSGSALWATGLYPRALFVPPAAPNKESHRDLGEEGPKIEHPHLHAANDVIGYEVSASDGEVGHVEDFILEEDDWTIRFVVIATRNWLPGKHVLVPASRLEKVIWRDHQLKVAMTRDAIKEGPEYDSRTPINAAVETKLYDFEGRPHN